MPQFWASLQHYPQWPYLVLSSLIAASVTGVLGLGGGVIFLATLAQTTLPPALTAVDAVVQLFSNGFRTVISHKNILWHIVKRYCIGVVIGLSLMRSLAVFYPHIYIIESAQAEFAYTLALALFIVIGVLWQPKINVPALPGKWYWVGILSGCLSLIFGATGPVLAIFFIGQQMNREQSVATRVAGQALLNIGKIAVFVSVGFSYEQYLPLFVLLVPASILGSIIGKYVLYRIKEQHFLLAFKTAILLLSIKMVTEAFLKL